MNTELLFRKDPYKTEFSAKVISCEKAKEGYLIELDRTCFYPEGGGQPADNGTAGEAKITDVHEKEGRVLHLADKAVPVGSEVSCKIDWQRRFSHMQHHSAEHIVSGIIHAKHKLDNVGFHMGSAMVTIDFNGELTREQIEEAQKEANRVVFANLAVEESYPGKAELAALDYRSKKELSGEVRIVTVPSADCCACCGTHVSRTGEIGLIKLLSPQRYKGGIRIGLLCGEKALEDYCKKEAEVTAVSQLLSAKPFEISQAVQRLLGEAEKLRAELHEARSAAFAQKLNGLKPSDKPCCLFEGELSSVELKQFSQLLSEKQGCIAAVFSCNGEGGFKYAMAAAHGGCRELSKAMHLTLGGKGGGNEQAAQGFVPAAQNEIESFFANLT